MARREEKARRMQLRRDLGWRAAPVPEFRVQGGAYLIAYARFACRKCFKRHENDTEVLPCPHCGGDANWLGRSFRAPRRSDLSRWRAVEALWRQGFRFFSYRHHPEAEPLLERFPDVAAFLQRNPQHPFRVRPPAS